MRTPGRPFFNVVRCHTVGCTGRPHPAAGFRSQPIDTIVMFRLSELFFSPRLRASKQIRLLSTTATGFSSNWITNELKATGSFVQLKRNPRADFETIFGTEGVTSIIDSLIKVGCVCVCAE